MKKVRILSLLVAAIMICTLFAGCGLFGGKTVMTVGGNPISEKIYEGALAQAASYFSQNFGIDATQILDMELSEGVTGADVIKENADSFVLEFESVNLFAKENGVALTAEDKKQLKEDKKAQIEAAGGRKAFLESLASNGISETFYDYFVACQKLYTKISEELFAADGKYAPTADMMIKNLEGYARVKHVLVMAQKDAEDYAEKKALAESVVSRARAGEDFDALITELGEDPGMQSYPYGYIIDKDGYTLTGSQMIKEFTDASHALAIDGVSDIVPSDYGFHIIKRYTLDENYVKENAATLAPEFSFVAFTEQMNAYIEGVEVVHADAYDKIDIHKVLGADKPLGAGAEEEHSADDGHDHGAEAEVPEIELTPVTE